MKHHIIQIALSLVFTFLAFLGGIALSIETPVSVSESYVLALSAAINLVWLTPYFVYFIKSKEQSKAINSLLIYFVFVIPFIVIRIHSTRFDSVLWKQSINKNQLYNTTPAHTRGDMVEDLIDRQLLLNKTIEEVENILGTNHFEMNTYHKKNTIWYFYSNQNPFEGCDKIYIVFYNGISVDAGIGGCD